MVAQGVFATGSLSSYCTVEEVLAVLKGFDLTAYGDGRVVSERVKELLPGTKDMVDAEAGRDFHWHGGETVAADGSGSDCLRLREWGAAPPVFVNEVQVGGRVLGDVEWCAYAESGLLRLTLQARQASFPKGVQNVLITADWGFAGPPGKVRQAQAKLAAAEILAELCGEGGAVEETRLGDYSVRYASGGRYAGSVRRLVEEATQELRRYRPVGVQAV